MSANSLTMPASSRYSRITCLVVLEERVRVADHELAARRDARLEAAAAVLAHLLAREPRSLDAVAVIVQRRELNDGTLEPLLRLSAAGQPFQNLPGAEMYLPTAVAGLLSVG